MDLVPATPDRAAEMAQVHATAFDEPWREHEFEDLLAGAGVFGFLVIDDGQPLGVLLARIAADEMEILTIGVAPGARRLGVGKALMAGALGIAAQAGAASCFLEVAVDNEAAARLYRALGFAREGLRREYYARGEERIDAFVLRRDLNASGGSPYPEAS
jgi:[ribosomal protein S18]-alanine N-acetyltransferase